MNKIKLVSCPVQWQSLRGNYVHYVYLFLTEDGSVLYIGKTGDVEKRWGEHCRTSKNDMGLVKEVEVIAYESPSEASFAEIQGLLYYDPPWNKYPLSGYMSKVRINYICRALFEVVSE